MKRTIVSIVAALLAVASVATLAGCGGNNDKKESTASAASQADASKADDASKSDAAGALADQDTIALLDGVAIDLNGTSEEVIGALGTNYTLTTQTSCHASEGEDKTYTYEGFTINTYPNNGVESVLEVIITKDSFTTSKGVKVGDSLSALTAAYGENYRKIGQAFYVYETADGKKQIRFSIENDTVTQIDYYYNV